MIKLKLKKARSYTGIVSATKEKPYVTVEDEATANAAVASGFFEIVEVSAAEEKPTGPATGAITKLDAMSIKQLKEYAKANDIDITGASKKEEILGRIEAAQAKPDGKDGEDENDPSGQFIGGSADDKALEELSDDELKEIAEKNTIDPAGLESREEILAAIKAAEPSNTGDEGDGGSE